MGDCKCNDRVTKTLNENTKSKIFPGLQSEFKAKLGILVRPGLQKGTQGAGDKPHHNWVSVSLSSIVGPEFPFPGPKRGTL